VLYGNLIEAIGNTPLVEMPRLSPKPGVQFYAKLEGQNPTGSVKDRIAKYMIEAAEEAGELKSGRTLLEPTSVYSDGAKGTNGSIAVAQEMVAENPDEYHMLYQYGNEANSRAHYETTGPEILRDLPDIDIFVSGLGTGGTLTGVGHYLKEHRPDVKIVACVPHPGDLVQGLRSLDEGFIPPVLDQEVLDGKIVVDSRSSFAGTKELAQQEGILAGISAGAALRTAQKVAERVDKAKIVILFADGGWKYLSTSLWTKDYDDLIQDVEGKVWW
jgi:cysteine synthase B